MPPQNPQDPRSPYPQPNPQPAATPPQSYAAMPPQQALPTTPYDFFMAQQQRPKKTLLPKNSSGFTKVIIAAVVIFILLIAAAVVLNVIRSSHKTTTPGFTSVIQDQQEIIRVSTLGTQNLESASLQNFANTAIVSTTSAQQKTTAYVLGHGGTVDLKLIAAADNKTTDNTLTASLATSTYDQTFKTIIQGLLTTYEDNIQQVHDATTVESQRNLLDADMSGAQLLDKMLNE